MRFSFSNMIQDLEAIKTLGGEFLALPETLNAPIRDLVNFRDGQRADYTWAVEQALAITTKPSTSFEGPGRKGDPLFGKLAFKWEISRVKPEKKKETPKFFDLIGLGSIAMELCREDASLVDWHFDIATSDGPGCHFHAQWNGNSGVPVPRLPSPIITPADALDFLLGELFQHEYQKVVETAVGPRSFHRSHWTKSHKNRLDKVFDHWKSVYKSRHPSVGLRVGKPSSTLFYGY